MANAAQMSVHIPPQNSHMMAMPLPMPAAALAESASSDVSEAVLPAAENMMMVGITVPSSAKIARSANP